MAKPKIRFKGYQDDWEQRKSGDMAPLRGGFAFKSNEYCSEGVPIVRISNILSDGSVGSDFAYYNEQNYDEVYTLYDGAAVLAMSGATTGKVSVLYAEKGQKYYQNQRVGYFVPTDTCEYSFIRTIMRSQLFADQLSAVLVAGAQPNVSSKEIDGFEFMIPKSIDEQRWIGEYFQSLDRLITLHQRKCDESKKIKKFMLQKMFPQNGSLVPEIRFDGFTDDWEQRKVSEMFKVTRGYVLPATDASEEISDEMPYPVYSSQTKDNGLMGYYSDYLYEDAITWTTDGANAGTVNFRYGRFYCTNVCGVLLSNKVEASKAVAEALNNVAKRYVSYVGNPKLMNNVMADIQIKIPTSREERAKISSYFFTLDHLITLHQQKCDDLKKLKKYMLQNMFVLH